MSILNIVKKFILTSALTFTPAIFASADLPTDAEIVPNLKALFAADKTTAGLKISISSKGGIVTLAGKVDTDAEAIRLIQIAEMATGVEDVITAKLTAIQSKHRMTDTTITTKIKLKYIREKVFADKDIAVMGVDVETVNGVAHLTGTVDTQTEADNAIKFAKSIRGVKQVDSRLAVQKPETVDG
ncbi:MAG: BON domain-containing protein [Gammaproteobacteria bacterium]